MTVGRLLFDRRAVAAIEFALLCPMLLMCVGGLADFGLALADRSRLANAVAQAAQYGYLNPSTVTVSAIQTLVTAGASLPGTTVNVTGPGYYCVTASAPPVLATATATSTCLDGTSSGYYVQISATYIYAPLMPGYSKLGSTNLIESVTARIQ
jgi:Flp pilus assembly protein TadG